jgi:steroid 5-alpha reductase family enzyme
MKSALNSIAVIFVLLTLVVGVASLSSQGMPLVAGMTVPLWVLVFALLSQWLGFIHAYVFQTERYYDLIGALANLGVILFTIAFTEHRDGRSYLLAVCIVLWALRLGRFLFARILSDGGDGRFDDIKPNFFRFLLTWTLQGVWVFVIQLCAILAISGGGAQPLGVIAIVGGGCWSLGMLIETIADSQKRQFRAKPENRDRYITLGLWSWSRHPNYFGEILLWIGVAIIALPALNGWMYLGLLSPCFVIFLLTKVSGIPLLEARADLRWGGDAEYERYKTMTPVLIPRRPR